MVNEIQWADGAVCYAHGKQQYQCSNLGNFLNAPDFQLNEIRERDFVPSSEIGAEHRYNDVVEVFGLFGFHPKNEGLVDVWGGVEVFDGEVANTKYADGRRLTYTQVMRICKLKRMMDEREKSAPEIAPDLTADFGKGQKHDQSKPRFSLIPLEPLQDAIAVLEFGAAKYGAENWKHVENPQQRYLDAAMRHIMAWQSGDLVDEESGLPHLAHAQCCLLFLQHFDK